MMPPEHSSSTQALPVDLVRARWRPEPPDEGLGRFTHRPPPPDALTPPRERERQLLAELQAEDPDWAWLHLNGLYPVLGGGTQRVRMTFEDVDIGTRSERGRVRIYHFEVAPLREQITQDILDLEYRMATVPEGRFERTLHSYLKDVLNRYAVQITSRFPCEDASIFLFHARPRDEPHQLAGSYVIRCDASYGMPSELATVPETYWLPADGEPQQASLANFNGVISEFVGSAEATRWIALSKEHPESWRDRCKRPNIQNLIANARLGDAYNCLLLKLALPDPSDGGPAQVFGVLRLVNCFRPLEAGFEPLPVERPKQPGWTHELQEVAQHLAIMYQQWLRIARRLVVARAVERITRDLSLEAFVTWLTGILQRLLDLPHVELWKADAAGKMLYPTTTRQAPLEVDASNAGVAFAQDDTAVFARCRDADPDRIEEPHARSIDQRASGFAIPIHGRRGKWGVLCFYDTWASEETGAFLFREETATFCQTLADIVAAKLRLVECDGGASHSAGDPDTRREQD